MMTEQERFNKLVECAEEYIKTKALKIIGAIRQTNCEENNCFNVIYGDKEDKDKKYYRPLYKIDELEKEKNESTFKNILIKRFCVELQNQSGRSNAIKYCSHSENGTGDDDENDILEIVKNYYNENQEYNWCDLYKKFKEKPGFIIGKENNNKYVCEYNECVYLNECDIKEQTNYGWREYCRGLADALNYINTYSKSLIDKIENNIINGNPETRKKWLKSFTEIHGIGPELAYDFFKELCCENLIKPDVHIKYLYKEVIKGQKTNSFDIAEDFIQMCKAYQENEDKQKYTPYYIDKILWLCCTGNFYKEDITINSMSRENFFKFIDFKLENK